MTSRNTFKKDPTAVLDFGINWSDVTAVGGPWLQGGETITASTWTVPAGLTKNSDSKTSSATTVWLSGGTPGAQYQITNTITTSAGRTDSRSLTITITNR